MTRTLGFISLAFILSTAAWAGTVNYNTTGSTLSCNGVAGCVQNTSTSVTVGGLTLTYNSGSGSGVSTPSIVNFGNIVSTGTSNGVSVTGILLSINVNSTPPGASGSLQNGSLSGSIATNNSSTTILFSPNNTSSGFGTLPGVRISGGGQSFIYQILNSSLGIQAPTVGNPVGQTSIQGAVSDVSGAAGASFLGTDTMTRGTWKGNYGSDGEIVALDSFNPAPYATINFGSASLFQWAFTSDSRAMQQSTGTNRIASTYYASPTFTVDLNITDANTHLVSLYFLDWDGQGRAETISITDATSNAVLDTRSISDFAGGKYVLYDIKGHVKINFTSIAGANAVLNAVFFDPGRA